MSIFNKVKVRKPKRSTFNLSHNSKLTFPMGELVPTYWNYFEPNTSFRASSIIQARTMPMLAPIMHEVNVYSYWFKVPVRLLMEEQDYENFITGGVDGTMQVNYPKYAITDPSRLQHGTALLDYLDVPVHQFNTEGFGTMVFDAVPFRAYAKIWNDFFRDQNTMAEVNIPMFTGTRADVELTSDDHDLLSMKRRCWTKDYFTSALPWAQRGGNVDMPFTAVTDLAMEGISPSKVVPRSATGEGVLRNAVDGQEGFDLVVRGTDSTAPAQVDVTPHTKASTRIQGTINDLRMAFSLQRWKERNALGGARYIEQINSHFGVWADDYRLQRPQYLGGARSPLQISEVLQTSESTKTSVQGNMTGRGYTMDNQGFVNCFCKEHCIIMNLICVIPKASYFQGLPRKLDIRDKFDFPWPILAHLGEQEVRNSEIYCVGDTYDGAGSDDEPFGYQSRYAQYKYEPNRIHGDFAESLQFWNLSRMFANPPRLNRDFLLVDEFRDGLSRIFPVVGEGDVYKNVLHHYWAQINFNIKVKRPLPYYGTPNL